MYFGFWDNFKEWIIFMDDVEVIEVSKEVVYVVL